MEHKFETMDSACTAHSNFRPPQNDESRANDSLNLSHVPVPVVRQASPVQEELM